MSLCKLHNVVKEYQGEEHVRPVDGVTMEVQPGDFLTIEGPSGTGKSTLLYMMGGLLRPTSGEIHLSGQDMTSLDDAQLTKLRSRCIGFIFQEANLLPALSALENLLFALRLRRGASPTGEERRRSMAMLDTLGLGERMHFLPYQLSVGQRRRIAIARALITNSALLIADEPTNDLDPHWAQRVMELLQEQSQQGKAVVMVTHHDIWASWARHRYYLDNGQLRAREEPAEARQLKNPQTQGTRRV